MLPHFHRAQFSDLFPFPSPLISLVISFSLMALNSSLHVDNSHIYTSSRDLSSALQAHIFNCLTICKSNRHLRFNVPTTELLIFLPNLFLLHPDPFMWQGDLSKCPFEPVVVPVRGSGSTGVKGQHTCFPGHPPCVAQPCVCRAKGPAPVSTF